MAEDAMIRAEDVVDIYASLAARDIQAWITGGWGIDALLGEQTRPHKDLDVIVLVDDVARIRDLLGNAGYRLKMLWEENRWDVDSQGNEIPTGFVLQDAGGREVDAHAMRLDDGGNGIPAWEARGLVLTSQDLAGEGCIAGVVVRCVSAARQLAAHTGYDLPPYQVRDVELLREKFGIVDLNGQ